MDINRNGVDMLIDKKRLNIYFAFVIISVIAVDLFMFNREGIHGNGIDSCAYDGIFVWGVYKMLIIGFFPIIMISIWGAMHDEISRNICIVRMNSRFKLWLRQETAFGIKYCYYNNINAYIILHGIYAKWQIIMARIHRA